MEVWGLRDALRLFGFVLFKYACKTTKELLNIAFFARERKYAGGIKIPLQDYCPSLHALCMHDFAVVCGMAKESHLCEDICYKSA